MDLANFPVSVAFICSVEPFQAAGVKQATSLESCSCRCRPSPLTIITSIYTHLCFSCAGMDTGREQANLRANSLMLLAYSVDTPIDNN